jgi:ribonuclease D
VLLQDADTASCSLEWEPYTWPGGVQGPTALAQVCDEKTILLIHVAKMPSFSPSLRALVEDPSRIKLGVQISGDAQKLVRDGFVKHPAGMLELNHVARAIDATHKPTNSWGLIGLQALVAKYLGRQLLKEGNVRKGKWAATLGEAQKNCELTLWSASERCAG